MKMNKLFMFTKVPSVNRYWRVATGGHRYIGKEGLLFKRKVVEYSKYRHFVCFREDVEVHINWYKKGRLNGDLDNILKVILDSLKGIAFFDDKQVKRIIATMWEQTGYDAIEIQVAELDLTIASPDLSSKQDSPSRH